MSWFCVVLFICLAMTIHGIHTLLSQVKPLIWVEAQVERHSRSRIEIMVKARSQFKERRYVLEDLSIYLIFLYFICLFLI